MKKFACLLICLSLFMGIFSACGNRQDTIDSNETTTKETTTAQPLPERKIVLGYYEDKSLNPFTTQSPTNRNLMTLVYDSLFLPCEGYTVEPLIALSFTNKDKILTVTLDSEAVFSDGSYITPHDVVASFNAAKQSNHYSGRLQNFSVASPGTNSVDFTLVSPDIYAENCLVFPIVKSSTIDEDIPIGSGRYTLSKKSDSYSLIANENSVRLEEMSTDTISLIPITSDKGELYLLQTGDLTYFFDDLSDGEYTKIRANTVKVPLNNMVYMGINSKTEALNDKNVKDAICCVLSKSSLCDTAYSGIARASDIPFNPYWQIAASVETDQYETNSLKAEELLEQSGYKFEYSTNKFRSKNFEFLELTLIVNSESSPKVRCAETITKSLKNIGIDLKLKKLSYSDYVSALEKGEYDLYIGEVKLTPDMSLAPFFDENGSLNFGIDTSSAAAKAYYDFSSGKIDISTFIQVFTIDKPFIPLLFREGIAYYSRELTFEDTINEYEPFRNIYSWSVIN